MTRISLKSSGISSAFSKRRSGVTSRLSAKSSRLYKLPPSSKPEGLRSGKHSLKVLWSAALIIGSSLWQIYLFKLKNALPVDVSKGDSLRPVSTKTLNQCINPKQDLIKINPLTTKTMTSTQLAEMLHKEKKAVNRYIKKMFQDKIDGGIITPSKDSRGYVTDYHLPELESKMFVATKDTKILETSLRKSGEKTLPKGSITEVQVPDNQAANARRLGKIFGKKIVFIENSFRSGLDFEGVTIPALFPGLAAAES